MILHIFTPLCISGILMYCRRAAPFMIATRSPSFMKIPTYRFSYGLDVAAAASSGTIRMMGGNSFESTVRLTRPEKDRVGDAVLKRLHAMGMLARSPSELEDKVDFGDVDLVTAIPNALIAAHSDTGTGNAGAAGTMGGDIEEYESGIRYADVRQQFVSDVKKAVMSEIKCIAEPVHLGKDSYSFLSEDRYQVDVDIVPESKFAINVAVHSNGDFTWLLERSLRLVSLMLTTSGLFIRHDYPELEMNLSRERQSFLLSTDPAQIASYLGLPLRAFDGTTSLSSIEAFEIIASSRFFNSYSCVSHSSVERKRQKKRPLVEQYFEWWASSDRKPVAPVVTANSVFFQEVATYFNRKLEYDSYLNELRTFVADSKAQLSLKETINGKLLTEWYPHLNGPQIGQLMSRIRELRHEKSFSWTAFSEWLKGLSKEQLKEAVRSLYSETEWV